MQRICLALLPFFSTLPLEAIESVFAVRLAIFSYDPVAYCTAAKPVPGQPKFQHKWQGARWLFSSAENRDACGATPTKFAPQYSGYCAYDISNNQTAPIDPLACKIIDDKL